MYFLIVNRILDITSHETEPPNTKSTWITILVKLNKNTNRKTARMHTKIHACLTNHTTGEKRTFSELPENKDLQSKLLTFLYRDTLKQRNVSLFVVNNLLIIMWRKIIIDIAWFASWTHSLLFYPCPNRLPMNTKTRRKLPPTRILHLDELQIFKQNDTTLIIKVWKHWVFIYIYIYMYVCIHTYIYTYIFFSIS